MRPTDRYSVNGNRQSCRERFTESSVYCPIIFSRTSQRHVIVPRFVVFGKRNSRCLEKEKQDARKLWGIVDRERHRSCALFKTFLRPSPIILLQQQPVHCLDFPLQTEMRQHRNDPLSAFQLRSRILGKFEHQLFCILLPINRKIQSCQQNA